MAMNFDEFEQHVRELMAAEKEERAEQEVIKKMKEEIEKREKVGDEIDDRIREIKRRLCDAGLLRVMRISFFGGGHVHHYVVSVGKWHEVGGNYLRTLREADGTMIGYRVSEDNLATLNCVSRKELFPFVDKTSLSDIEREVRKSIEEYNAAYSGATTVVVETATERPFAMAFLSFGQASRAASRIEVAMGELNINRDRVIIKITRAPQTSENRMLLIWSDRSDCGKQIESAFETCMRALHLRYSRPLDVNKDRDRS